MGSQTIQLTENMGKRHDANDHLVMSKISPNVELFGHTLNSISISFLEGSINLINLSSDPPRNKKMCYPPSSLDRSLAKYPVVKCEIVFQPGTWSLGVKFQPQEQHVDPFGHIGH